MLAASAASLPSHNHELMFNIFTNTRGHVGTHAWDLVAVEVTTSSPSLLMRFFSCMHASDDL